MISLFFMWFCGFLFFVFFIRKGSEIGKGICVLHARGGPGGGV